MENVDRFFHSTEIGITNRLETNLIVDLLRSSPIRFARMLRIVVRFSVRMAVRISMANERLTSHRRHEQRFICRMGKRAGSAVVRGLISASCSQTLLKISFAFAKDCLVFYEEFVSIRFVRTLRLSLDDKNASMANIVTSLGNVRSVVVVKSRSHPNIEDLQDVIIALIFN